MSARPQATRVLHVDDEPDFAELAADLIERQDDRLAVETALTAEAALERLAAADFDCVVSDYDMPGLDGIELLEAVRADHPDLPFILYTGKGSEEVASDAMSAGVSDYLQKGTGTSQYELLAKRIHNVVERRQARAEAVETERRLQTIAENTNDVLWKFTGDWDELLFINSAYEAIWGRSVEELEAEPRSFLEGVHPEDRDLVTDAMAALSAGESVDIEYRVNAQEDFGRWVWVQGEPILDDGEVENVVGFARDITERKAETERHEALIEQSLDIVTVIDGDGVITYQSPAVERVLGYDLEALVGEVAFDFLHPDDRVAVAERFAELVETPEAATERETYRFRHADGSWVWLETVARNELDSAIGGYVLNSRDVTARVEREQELRETKARLEAANAEQERLNDAFETFLETVSDADRSFDQQLDELLALGVDLLDLDIGILSRIEPPDYTVEHVAADGSIEPGDRFDLEETFCSLVYAADGPVAFHSPTDGGVEHHPAYRDLGLESYLGEPLFVRGERYGTLNFSSPDARAEPFSAAERAFVRALAEWLNAELSRREREHELEESRERFRTLFEESPDAVFLYGSEGEIIDVNRRACENLGYDHGTLTDLTIWEFSSAEPDEVLPMWREMAPGDTKTFEGTHERADGSTFPVRVRVTRADLGDDIQFIGLARDITEEKAREAELERERDRLNALFENTIDPIVFAEFVDGVPYVRDLNPAFAATFGCDRDAALGEPVDDIVVPEDEALREEAEALNERIISGEAVTAEVRRRTVDGPREFLVQSTPLRPGERGSETYAIYNDISERKTYERALQGLHEASHRLLAAETHEEAYDVVIDIAAAVLDHPFSAVYRYDPAADELLAATVSGPAREVFGDPPPFAVGEGLTGTAFETGEVVVVDDAHRDPRGRDDPGNPIRGYGVFPLGDHGAIVFGSPEVGTFDEQDAALASNLAAHATVALDRIEREGRLQRQNERLDEFAGVVSHDLRNPLGVATGRLELAREDCDSEHFEPIARAHDRMETLIDDMLSLARAGDAVGETQPVALVDLVENCWRNVRTESATLTLDADATFRADETRLRQLVENLLKNAIEHGGETVTITVGTLTGGFYVEDDGPGIPADERDAVLEPGYTTSEAGAGFGLSIVRDIADAHGWSVTVGEGDDGGARFEFRGIQSAG